MTRPLSPELLRLLDKVLDTFEKLDLAWELLGADGPLSISELQTTMQLDSEALLGAARELARAGIVTLDRGSSSIALGPRAKHDDFQALMQLYGQDRLVVISALTSIAMNRIRTMAARTFADGFLLRSDKRRDSGGDTGND